MLYNLVYRRDIAMLGVLHRTVLGEGPPQFCKWFFPAAPANHCYPTGTQRGKHDRTPHDWLDGSHTALLQRTALGLPRVYNNLTAKVVRSNSVRDFQKALQNLVRQAVKNKVEDWQSLLSPRRERTVAFTA